MTGRRRLRVGNRIDVHAIDFPATKMSFRSISLRQATSPTTCPFSTPCGSIPGPSDDMLGLFFLMTGLKFHFERLRFEEKRKWIRFSMTKYVFLLGFLAGLELFQKEN